MLSTFSPHDPVRAADSDDIVSLASMTSSRRGSVGEPILDLKLETPAEERLMRALEEREKILAKKERKLNETIALLQEKSEVSRWPQHAIMFPHRVLKA
jgi:hypothetical protein